MTTAAGATAAEPRPTTSSRAGRRGLSLEDGAGVGEAVLAPEAPEVVSVGMLEGAVAAGELAPVLAPAVVGSLGDRLGDEVVGTDVVGVALLEVGTDVAVPDGVGVLGVVTGVAVQLTDSLSALPP